MIPPPTGIYHPHVNPTQTPPLSVHQLLYNNLLPLKGADKKGNEIKYDSSFLFITLMPRVE